MNIVHFCITFKLPVVGRIDAGVQTADLQAAKKKKKKLKEQYVN